MRLPAFRLLVAGQAISVCGDMFFLIALPFLIFRDYHGTTALTFTLLTFGCSRLATVLPGGALADRFGPRWVMISADLLRCLAVTALTIAVAGGRPGIWLLLTVGAVLGAGEGGYEPAERSMTPLLVSDEQLPAANSVTVTTTVAARVIGPAAGGVGVAFASPTLMLGLDAASFAASIITLLMIRCGPRPAADGEAAPGRRLETVVGFFRRSAFFRMVTLMMTVVGLSVAGTLQIALPVLADQGRLGASGYGYLMSALGAGMVAGGLAGGPLARLSHQGWQALGYVAVNGALLAALPSLPGTGAKLAGMALLGASDGALTVVVITALQRMPPPHLRARVLAVLTFAMVATYPLSVLAAGSVVSELSAPVMFRLTGAGIAIAAVIGAASRAVRDA
jgi:MFS family permease